MQERVVGQVAVGPDPQALDGLLGSSPCFQGRSPMWRWSMGWGRANQSASSSRQGASRSGRLASVSGSGTSGMGTGGRGPVSSTWNEAAMLKMAWPCWMATTRRVVKDRPSRMRSTS